MIRRATIFTGLLAGLVALAVRATDSSTDDRLDRLARWLRSPRESIRLEAVTELSSVPVADALSLLLSALTDTSVVVRAAVSGVLQHSRDPRVIPALRPLLKDADEHV